MRAYKRGSIIMNMRPILKVILLAALIASPVSADTYAPSHMCSKPYKPYQFDSQWEIDNFLAEVERYKHCISDFVDEQHEAARTHQEAASEAIDEWNHFVNYELD